MMSYLKKILGKPFSNAAATKPFTFPKKERGSTTAKERPDESLLSSAWTAAGAKSKSGFTTASEGENDSSLSFFPSAAGAKARSAFTLIELLVVIAIIGILSSVVLASLAGARQSARDTRRISNLKQIQVALEQFHAKCNSYPTTLPEVREDLGINRGCGSGGGHPTGFYTLADFMSQVPLDPSGDYYGYDGSQNTHCIAAELEGDAPENDADCSAEGNIPSTTNNGGETYSLIY